MTKANFFMVGAPKTATTAISQYLRTHSKVFMCDPKEPYYFCSDVGPSPFAQDLRQYVQLFSAAERGHSVIAEASSSYLLSSTAYENIYKFNPDAKILVTLRDPVELVYAWHSEMLYAGEESVADFERAWALQGQRAGGRRVPFLCTRPLLLQYQQVGLLGAGLEKYLRRFGKSQVTWILFDDFKTDPRAEYARLLDFLELPQELPERFPRVNSNKRRRVPLVGRTVRYLRHRFAAPISRAYRMVGMRGSGMMMRFDRLDSKAVDRPAVPVEFSTELKAVFRPDIQKLEDLIGRDLAHWYR